jgi:hypothetical protein
VPFDIAFSLQSDERHAFVIAIGTLDGRSFDWSTGQWTDRKPIKTFVSDD